MFTTIKNFVSSLIPGKYILSFGQSDGTRNYFTVEEIIDLHPHTDDIWQHEIQVLWQHGRKTALLVKAQPDIDRATIVLHHKSALIEYPILRPSAIIKHAAEVARYHESILQDGCTDRTELTKSAIEYVQDEEIDVLRPSPYHLLTDDRRLYMQLFVATYVFMYIACVKKHKST
ncbi:hypothetical protein KDW_27910 [Dictyobacter vulcani]|uniref:Uncharacterized protein n=1 Tax=Dictyobacter vulcani TaxID=2607529 RepID=A0A5J4KR73_9CHLR|nr:hypothetical protein [Dictyobacter vulcani]GER88629.1 hypothetical protein KDW_27910 [Dictyobacter vulcani]